MSRTKYWHIYVLARDPDFFSVENIAMYILNI